MEVIAWKIIFSYAMFFALWDSKCIWLELVCTGTLTVQLPDGQAGKSKGTRLGS